MYKNIKIEKQLQEGKKDFLKIKTNLEKNRKRQTKQKNICYLENYRKRKKEIKKRRIIRSGEAENDESL